MLRFGTSGIRGIFNEDFDLKAGHNLCYALSRSFSGEVGLGYDTRVSSKVLADSIMSGLSYYGVDVTSFGLLPTPVMAFAVRELGYKAGLMLTASHNPPEYTGIKVFDEYGAEIGVGVENNIERYTVSIKKRVSTVRLGKIGQNNGIRLEYIKRIISKLSKTKKRLRILIDCGNGATTEYTPKILNELGHQVITVNSHHSSSSLGRILEPKVGTLKETSRLVKLTQSDLGIAHDGDGDRAVLIDEKGRVLQDQVFSSFVLRVLLERKLGKG